MIEDEQCLEKARIRGQLFPTLISSQKNYFYHFVKYGLLLGLCVSFHNFNFLS